MLTKMMQRPECCLLLGHVTIICLMSAAAAGNRHQSLHQHKVAASVRQPRFDGTGFLALPSITKTANIGRQLTASIEFRPEMNDGLLLYNGDKDTRDFIGIWLIGGHVHVRFDCGSGEAVLETNNTIHLNEWNTIEITQTDSNGLLQLNENMTRGRSKGPMKRLTVRDNLFIGGYHNYSALLRHTDTPHSGLVGCVRRVAINRHNYDMRRGAFTGDALYGFGVAECGSHLCNEVRCMNGGTCSPLGPDDVTCLCPLGTVGDQCQSKSTIYLPSFTDHSCLKLSGIGREALSFTDIELVLKTSRYNGLILYNGYTGEVTADFISLALVNGFIEFRFNLGTGPAVIRSRQPVVLDQWHTVHAKRTGRSGQLMLDDQPGVDGQSPGVFTQLTLKQDLYIGGYENSVEILVATGVTINGRELNLVTESLVGINIDNCNHPCVGQPCASGSTCVPVKDLYRCTCSQHGASGGPHCRDPGQFEPITTPSFSGSSYLMYSDPAIIQRSRGVNNDIEMRFRTNASNGLMYLSSEDNLYSSDWEYCIIGLRNGFIELSLSLGSGDVTTTWEHLAVNDGQWHTIRLTRYGRRFNLDVDGLHRQESHSPGHLTQLNTNGKLYIGGAVDVRSSSRNKYSVGFNGCISNVTLNNDLILDLSLPSVGNNITRCPYADNATSSPHSL